MSIDEHIRRGHPILFGFLLLFSIIAGCISAWLTAQYETNPGAAFSGLRSKVHFLLFTSWWTVVGSVLYIVLFLRAAEDILTSVASYGIFVAVTWVFWLAGSIALTVALGGGINCSSILRHIIFCNQLDALLAFAWISWIITTILLFAVLLRGISSLRRGDSVSGQL